MIFTELQSATAIIKPGITRRLNYLAMEKLRNHLLYQIGGPVKEIYLDLKVISFIDSDSFDFLKKVSQIASSSSKTFKVFNVSEELNELFDLVNEDDSIIIATLDEVDRLQQIEVQTS